MRYLFYLIVPLILLACGTAKKAAPPRRYPPATLRADYALFREVLESAHPGLYWYTPKDSMDHYFREGAAMIKDSLSEPAFRMVLNYVVSKIGCGHTGSRPSAAYQRANRRTPQFPLLLKIWPDTAVILRSLHAKDSSGSRGGLLKAIDGRPMSRIIDSLFQYLSTDGYNRTHKYQALSNFGNFSTIYPLVFGAKPFYKVTFTDSTGRERTENLAWFLPVRDSLRGKKPPPSERVPRKERRRRLRESQRSLRIEKTTSTAFLELNTFSKGSDLRGFFRRSFRKLRKEKVANLVIDLRANGGGSVTNSNLLTKYISDHRFRIADSLYAVERRGSLRKYQDDHFWSGLFLYFMTREREGRYHFRYFEKKYFNPRRRNHFNGRVYVINGGNTFSASTLFASVVGPQQNVTLIGEETGGGAYGNNAWLIPDVTLPNTRVRLRLPLFRLVIDKNSQKGYGVQPEVFAGPTVEAIRQNKDYKMEKVKELISRQ